MQVPENSLKDLLEINFIRNDQVSCKGKIYTGMIIVYSKKYECVMLYTASSMLYDLCV